MEQGNIPNFGVKKNKIVVALMLLILVVVYVGLYFYVFKPIFAPKVSDVPPVEQTESNRQDLPLYSASFYLEDMVPEKDIVVLDSFLLKKEDGIEQVTLVYETKNTTEKNLSLFKTYLNKNGWKQEGGDYLTGNNNFAQINAKKGGLNLTIKMSLNYLNKTHQVEISKVGNMVSNN